MHLYWIFKIIAVEDEIKSLKQLKDEYKRFREELTDVHKEVQMIITTIEKLNSKYPGVIGIMF